MKIVIPGGSGQVGRVLARAFGGSGHEVVILGRACAAQPVGVTSGEPGSIRFVAWDGKTLGAWASEIDGADVVINLAGRNVNCRYGEANRREILESRIDSTRIIGEAIARSSNPPRVWLQASTATIYAHRYDAPNDDLTGILGGSEPDAPDTWRFSIKVARAWELAVDEAVTPRTRKVKLRSAMTMSPDRGGIFDTLLLLVRSGLGGTAGDGRQYISWIHDHDFIAAVNWLIDDEALDGAINLAAPNPLPNAELMRVLREAWGSRIGLPAMEWMLAIGAFFLRTETELVLKSRRVVPRRLTDSGFRFEFPGWPDAAMDLVRRWRELDA